MSLKNKTLVGLSWTITQQFSVQIINLGVQVTLAKILAPDMFGLIAMLQVFISIGQVLMDGGMTSSLIRTVEPKQEDYSTVFWMNVISSVIIYLVFFLISPFIADFYNQPVLSTIIKIYTFSFVIQAFGSVQSAKLIKELKFKLQMMLQIPATILGGIVGLVLAFNGFGVWSLVWLNLVSTSVFMLLHWVTSGWVPSFIFDRQRLMFHFNFGYKLTLGGILNAVYLNVNNIIIGRYFSTAQLGYYSQADSFRMFPVNQISSAIDKVTYPIYAQIQNENERLKQASQSILQLVLIFVFPIMTILIVVADPLFNVMLNENWLPAIPMFQILCAAAIFYPLQLYNLNILKVKGMTNLMLKLELIKKPVIIVLMACVIPLGLYGLIWLQVFASFFLFYVNSFYTGKLINYPMKEQLTDLIPIALINLFTGLTCYGMLLWLSPQLESNILKVLVVLFSYLIMYLTLNLVFKPTSFKKLVELIMDIYKKLVIK